MVCCQGDLLLVSPGIIRHCRSPSCKADGSANASCAIIPTPVRKPAALVDTRLAMVMSSLALSSCAEICVFSADRHVVDGGTVKAPADVAVANTIEYFMVPVVSETVRPTTSLYEYERVSRKCQRSQKVVSRSETT